jgi:simple sugar transport system ATP-binding protein
MAEPAVLMRGITKSFGAVRALSNVGFNVGQGEVHALLGENGAGKSTLMNVLFGLLAPDSGSIEVFGRPLPAHSPKAALAAGIGLVQQHFSLVPRMSVAEHVALGAGGFRFDRQRARTLVRRVGKQTGLALDPDALADDLPAGLRQRLEIVKTLAHDVRVLILDEPTAALAPAEADELFVSIKRLTETGLAVVLITHKLREVRAVADHVTVLRRGEVVATGDTTAFTAESLAAAVIGDNAASTPARPPANSTRANGRAAVEVRHLHVRANRAERVHDASLEVEAGEIVGIAAVEGNGQRELLRAIAGMEKFTGTITLGPGHGVGFIPEDRQSEGLILDFPISENLALDAALGFWLEPSWLEGQAAVAIEEFDIRVAAARRPVRTLSGGNQQKVVLARVLSRPHAIVVAENPTRGLDVRATADVHARLRRAAQDGVGVLFHSSDLDEVLDLSDRVAVMASGRWRWVTEKERTRERIGAMMLGAA